VLAEQCRRPERWAPRHRVTDAERVDHHPRGVCVTHDGPLRTPVAQPAERLREQFGAIDIYLFDQLLRGRITDAMRVLDAGCGAGRNLAFLLREGFDVWGVDESADAVEQTRRLAAHLAPHLAHTRRTAFASSAWKPCRTAARRWTR